MSRAPRGPVEARQESGGRGAGEREEVDRQVGLAVSLALVEDLQGTGADLGWPEATVLVDALVDVICHLLVDLGSGRPVPTPRPAVVGAIGGTVGRLDHASCRAATPALRRAGSALLGDARGWAVAAGEVALDLADLLARCAERDRAGRLRPGDKSVVLRELHGLQRRLHALG
ncbi:hypothetical protein [Ornithinimicrobium cerasi]|uniref:hypothetical protein n=1 Tax=Ornithinimicrobium cerasi TaxID=2248773 RepID=UPI000EFEE424|nr:hypothetical protein [Ornithinimicrobium cerasi]